MILVRRLTLRTIALPLLLVISMALVTGCGASSAEAASESNDVPVAQVTARAVTPTATPAALTTSAQPAAVKAQSAAVETGIPTRLVLPTIKLDTGVVELGWSTSKNKAGQVFSEWDVPQYAAGWHKNSAEPGQEGNVVLSGHNNILGAVFRELDQLKRGDTAILYVGNESFEYSIDKVMIVPERTASAEQRIENGQWIQPTPEERLTLVSCWPRDDNSHRIIVIAHPVATN